MKTITLEFICMNNLQGGKYSFRTPNISVPVQHFLILKNNSAHAIENKIEIEVIDI